jgi:hypothetical protein
VAGPWEVGARALSEQSEEAPGLEADIAWHVLEPLRAESGVGLGRDERASPLSAIALECRPELRAFAQLGGELKGILEGQLRP